MAIGNFCNRLCSSSRGNWVDAGVEEGFIVLDLSGMLPLLKDSRYLIHLLYFLELCNTIPASLENCFNLIVDFNLQNVKPLHSVAETTTKRFSNYFALYIINTMQRAQCNIELTLVSIIW
jgi:hypothetical protein